MPQISLPNVQQPDLYKGNRELYKSLGQLLGMAGGAVIGQNIADTRNAQANQELEQMLNQGKPATIKQPDTQALNTYLGLPETIKNPDYEMPTKEVDNPYYVKIPKSLDSGAREKAFNTVVENRLVPKETQSKEDHYTVKSKTNPSNIMSIRLRSGEAIPEGYEIFKPDENFKRPGTFQVGYMNGQSYAIQGNPNNEQLEYWEPRQNKWVAVPAQMQFANQMLNAQEAAMLGVPFGTTKASAAGMGVSSVTPTQRANIASYDQSLNVINDIENYSSKVNKSEPGTAGMGRLAGGISNWVSGVTQSDTNVVGLNSKIGELSNLIRAMGEKGALAEGDVQRGLALVPTIWDTESVAKQKISDLRNLLQNNKSAFVSSSTMPIKQGMVSAQQSQSEQSTPKRLPGESITQFLARTKNGQ